MTTKEFKKEFQSLVKETLKTAPEFTLYSIYEDCQRCLKSQQVYDSLMVYEMVKITLDELHKEFAERIRRIGEMADENN